MKKKMEINLHVESEEFIIESIEPVCEKNKLFLRGIQNE